MQIMMVNMKGGAFTGRSVTIGVDRTRPAKTFAELIAGAWAIDVLITLEPDKGTFTSDMRRVGFTSHEFKCKSAQGSIIVYTGPKVTISASAQAFLWASTEVRQVLIVTFAKNSQSVCVASYHAPFMQEDRMISRVFDQEVDKLIGKGDLLKEHNISQIPKFVVADTNLSGGASNLTQSGWTEAVGGKAMTSSDAKNPYDRVLVAPGTPYRAGRAVPPRYKCEASGDDLVFPKTDVDIYFSCVTDHLPIFFDTSSTKLSSTAPVMTVATGGGYKFDHFRTEGIDSVFAKKKADAKKIAEPVSKGDGTSKRKRGDDLGPSKKGKPGSGSSQKPG